MRDAVVLHQRQHASLWWRPTCAVVSDFDLLVNTSYAQMTHLCFNKIIIFLRRIYAVRSKYTEQMSKYYITKK
jgi:hypothetical protein